MESSHFETTKTPLWVILPPLNAIGGLEEQEAYICTRLLASSLMRSLFTGRIHAANVTETPLFTLPRYGYTERHFRRYSSPRKGTKAQLQRQQQEAIANTAMQGQGNIQGGKNITRQELPYAEYLANLPHVNRRQWVIFSTCAGVAFNNLDHLFEDHTDDYSRKTETDLIWLSDEGKPSPLLWAVRGAYLDQFITEWKHCSQGCVEGSLQDRAEAAASLALAKVRCKKKRFETSQVAIPKLEALDWLSMKQSSLLLLPPRYGAESVSFLQSLYFGTYLADPAGVMLKIFDC